MRVYPAPKVEETVDETGALAGCGGRALRDAERGRSYRGECSSGIFLFVVNDTLGKWLVANLLCRPGAADPLRRRASQTRDADAAALAAGNRSAPGLFRVEHTERILGDERGHFRRLSSVLLASYLKRRLIYLPLADVMTFSGSAAPSIARGAVADLPPRACRLAALERDR